jgi:hypothetical protein
MRKGGKTGVGVKTRTGAMGKIGVWDRILSGWGTVTAGRELSAGVPRMTVDKEVIEGRHSPSRDTLVWTPIPD